MATRRETERQWRKRRASVLPRFSTQSHMREVRNVDDALESAHQILRSFRRAESEARALLRTEKHSDRFKAKQILSEALGDAAQPMGHLVLTLNTSGRRLFDLPHHFRNEHRLVRALEKRIALVNQAYRSLSSFRWKELG